MMSKTHLDAVEPGKDESDDEAQDVGEGGDGDGDSGLLVTLLHALFNAEVGIGVAPCGQDDELKLER